MSQARVPTVFVSSTCFDLSQVRADISAGIAAQGLEPMVSESQAFPVNPDVGAIENCLRAVRERADIFVLIVGARYGSIGSSGQSVTNLEYLEAKKKGVPIYVFVAKQILHMLPAWKRNRNGDFTGIVDSTELFRFVEDLHTAQDHWVYGFENATEITSTLRSQLAYLFMDALSVRAKLKPKLLPNALSALSPEQLQLVMEKPVGWEYYFFASLLEAEYEENRELKWDIQFQLKRGNPCEIMSDNLVTDVLKVCDWLQSKCAVAIALSETASNLMNGVKSAMAPLGTPADLEKLVYVARRIGEVHRRFLEWSLEFNNVKGRPEFERVLQSTRAFSSSPIDGLECFPDKIRTEISKAAAARARGEEYIAEVMIVFGSTYTPEHQAAMEELHALIKERPWN